MYRLLYTDIMFPNLLSYTSTFEYWSFMKIAMFILTKIGPEWYFYKQGSVKI